MSGRGVVFLGGGVKDNACADWMHDRGVFAVAVCVDTYMRFGSTGGCR